MRVSPPGRRPLPAQPGGLPGSRLVQPAFRGALEYAGDLGEQVGAAAREVAQRGHRGVLLVGGEVAPPGVVLRLAGQLGYEDTVGLRTIVDHAF
jgi:hypothetical protein